MSRRSVLVTFVVLVVSAAAIFGHLWYWYRPRPRPAVPKADSPVASLLASDRYPAVLWLPYPHQNLGALTPDTEAYEAYLGSCARLVGLPAPVLPSFGGFAVVPSHEIVLASDDEGRRFVVMARVYPSLARFARLAGRVSGNPWLAGGRVVVRGEPADVRWDGDTWIVRDADAAPLAAVPTPSVPTEANPASLAVLALHGAVDPFPAGRYRLDVAPDGVAVRSESAVPEPVWQRARAVHRPDLVLLVGAGGGADRSVRARALAIFAQARESTDLPRAVSFNEQGESLVGRPWEVPGEDLAALAGGLKRERAGVWDVASLGRSGLRAALELRPRLDPLLGHEAATEGVSWLLVSDLGNTLVEVERIADLLESIPLIPAHEGARWRDAATVLRPVAGRFDTLTIAIADTPRSLRLVLSAREP